MNVLGDARAVADSTRGIRSIRFSPDGQHLVVGDRAGNLKLVMINTTHTSSFMTACPLWFFLAPTSHERYLPIYRVGINSGPGDQGPGTRGPTGTRFQNALLHM